MLYEEARARLATTLRHDEEARLDEQQRAALVYFREVGIPQLAGAVERGEISPLAMRVVVEKEANERSRPLFEPLDVGGTTITPVWPTRPFSLDRLLECGLDRAVDDVDDFLRWEATTADAMRCVYAGLHPDLLTRRGSDGREFSTSPVSGELRQWLVKKNVPGRRLVEVRCGTCKPPAPVVGVVVESPFEPLFVDSPRMWQRDLVDWRDSHQLDIQLVVQRAYSALQCSKHDGWVEYPWLGIVNALRLPRRSRPRTVLAARLEMRVPVARS